MTIFDEREDMPKVEPWDVAQRAANEYMRRFDDNPASIRIVHHTVDFGDFAAYPADEEFEWYGQRGKIRTVFRYAKGCEGWTMRMSVEVGDDYVTIRRAFIKPDVASIMADQILAAFRAHQMRQARKIPRPIAIVSARISIPGVDLDQL